MSLTLITNPVTGDSQVFPGFKPVEFIFKREDLPVATTESGTGGLKINIGSDLSTYLSAGDGIYIYSEGVNYTYDIAGVILSVDATSITTNIPFIAASTGGYINYLKNYYVEAQCVNKVATSANILPFSLESDGDNAGNITIDVSISNDLNLQRGAIAEEYIDNSSIEFYVQYRQVYTGSAESFTLLNTKLVILVYATETPEIDTILNNFELPKIYLGYPAAFAIAHEEGGAGDSMELLYDELDMNGNILTSDTLGSLTSENGGFYMWEWEAANTVENAARFINFEFSSIGTFDFLASDFDYPDFLTQ